MGVSIQFGNATADAKRLRKEAGAWLQAKRKAAGLPQIQLAEKLGLKYYTFVSQVENGFGRAPSESMEAWASALGLAPAEFARHLLSYYDPELHRLRFASDCWLLFRSPLRRRKGLVHGIPASSSSSLGFSTCTRPRAWPQTEASAQPRSGIHNSTSRAWPAPMKWSGLIVSA
jgi:transcriptional regulator with XRE-family HTH domain